MTTALDPNDAPAWSQWITNFDSSFRSFMSDWDNLSSPDTTDFVYNQHPELIAQYQDLISRGHTQLATLQGLKATRDYVASWLNWLSNGIQSGVDFVETSAQSAYDAAKAVLGLSGVRRSAPPGLGGLGVVPLVVIGIAAAAAALVIVGYWIRDYLQFAQRFNALKDQEELFKRLNPNATPAEIANAASSAVDSTLGPAGGGVNDNLLGIPWTYIIAGAVAVFLGPPLIELVSKRGARA